MIITKALDAYPELLIQRVNNKIQLIKSNPSAPSLTAIPLANLYKLAMPIYFYGFNNKIIGGNTAIAEWLGLASIRDIQNKPLKNFLDKSLYQAIQESNKKVLETQSLQIFSLGGKRKDNHEVSAITYRFPCYYENQFAGIFSCALKTDTQSLPDFLNNTLSLLSTGLIETTHPLYPSLYDQGTRLSPREEEVLRQILLGKTAKETGQHLRISVRTVEIYMASIKLKTKARNKYELIHKYKEGFLE